VTDAPGFEAQQARLIEQQRHATREQVVRHALGLLDPGLDLTSLSYREALDRLCAACMAEVQRLDAA
jgi:hypothetical protein